MVELLNITSNAFMAGCCNMKQKMDKLGVSAPVPNPEPRQKWSAAFRELLSEDFAVQGVKESARLWKERKERNATVQEIKQERTLGWKGKIAAIGATLDIALLYAAPFVWPEVDKVANTITFFSALMLTYMYAIVSPIMMKTLLNLKKIPEADTGSNNSANKSQLALVQIKSGKITRTDDLAKLFDSLAEPWQIVEAFASLNKTDYGGLMDYSKVENGFVRRAIQRLGIEDKQKALAEIHNGEFQDAVAISIVAGENADENCTKAMLHGSPFGVTNDVLARGVKNQEHAQLLLKKLQYSGKLNCFGVALLSAYAAKKPDEIRSALFEIQACIDIFFQHGQMPGGDLRSLWNAMKIVVDKIDMAASRRS